MLGSKTYVRTLNARNLRLFEGIFLLRIFVGNIAAEYQNIFLMDLLWPFFDTAREVSAHTFMVGLGCATVALDVMKSFLYLLPR